MRIISGKYKGRIITKSVPPGVRPTTDQARESMFNILAGYVDWDEARVLDLCAGTGALGFEALSRGAVHCDFVELNSRTAMQIDVTAQTLGIEKTNYAIHITDSLGFLRSIEKQNQYTVVFTDPPYHKKLLNSILRLLEAGSVVAQDGIFVAEHDISEVVLAPEKFSHFSNRKFGETMVDFYVVEGV